jgi:Cu(I)/Ag(I) efflux system membrane fusion protein
MRSPHLLVAGAGLALGACLVALVPSDVLFVTTATHDHAAPGAASGFERWACPMMDFISNKPGDCPVCGMTMTKVTAGELTLEQQRRMDVQLTTVREGPAQVTVRAYGNADYDNRYTTLVIPRVAGRIVKRYMATWGCCEQVSEGAPIVDLYSPEVFTAQGELLAAAKLNDQPTLSALRQRFARWNLADVADAVLAGEAPRDVITIRSPASGQALMRDYERVNEMVTLGKEVMADTPLLTLVDPEKLIVVVQVPESGARFLREGQAVQIESDDAGPLPQLQAKIDRLGREILPETRTREVRIFLRDASKLLQPGSLVAARLHGVLGPDLHPADPREEATWGKFVLVPKTAVLSTGVRHVAWRVAGRQSDGRLRFELAPLALGPRLEDPAGNDVYVVRAGLKAGDEVATQGLFLIDSQAQLAGTPSLLFPQGAVSSPSPHQH